MKAYILLGLCFLLAVVKAVEKEEMKEMFRGLAQECKEEVKASDDDVEDLINHKEELTGPAKCLKACMMKKFKLMGDDGKLNKEGVMDMARMMSENKEEVVKIAGEIVDNCKDVPVPADHCEAAQVYNKCIMKEVKERNLTEKFEGM